MSSEKSRILLVGESPASLANSARSLIPDFEAFTARDGAQAVKRLEDDGPFAAVVCEPAALLRAIRGARSQSGAGEANGAAPIDDAETEGTEPAGGGEPSSMSTLYRFCVALNTSEDLQSIARLAALATFESLGGRGVHVQLWDDDAHCGLIEASKGAEMSVDMHSEPLLSSTGKVGEIVVDLAGKPLDPREANILTLIAVPAAACVQTELRRRERDAAQRATILAMARLAERRDNETGKHLVRVSLYCELVARALRDNGHDVDLITEAFIEDLVRSAPLHDIGKVGIPDSILLKPGKLDAREWALMKTHAELGATVLDEVIGSLKNPGFLDMGKDIALCHHEKWDGSGYPRGLAGEEIPLSARILAIADVYDALTSARPYKDAWTHEASVEHIQGLASTHLDVRIVEAFMGHLPQIDSIRARLADEPEDMEALYEQLTTGGS